MKTNRIVFALLASFYMVTGAADLQSRASTETVVDNSLYGELLQKYVRDGKVD